MFCGGQESPSPHAKPGGPKGRHGPGLIMEQAGWVFILLCCFRSRKGCGHVHFSKEKMVGKIIQCLENSILTVFLCLCVWACVCSSWHTWIFQVWKKCAFSPEKPTKRQTFYIFGRSKPLTESYVDTLLNKHFPQQKTQEWVNGHLPNLAKDFIHMLPIFAFFHATKDCLGNHPVDTLARGLGS